MDLHRQCQTSCPAMFIFAIGFSLMHEWVRQRGTLQFPEPTFPPLWLVHFCEPLPKERFAKPIRKLHFCVECVRMNKDFFLFFFFLFKR